MYDLIEEKLLARVAAGKVSQSMREIALLLNALSCSGMDKYVPVFDRIRANSDDHMLSRWAKHAVKNIEEQKIWNSEIGRDLENVAPEQVSVARWRNILYSKNTHLRKEGQRRIRKTVPTDPDVRDVMVWLVLNGERDLRSYAFNHIDEYFPGNIDIKNAFVKSASMDKSGIKAYTLDYLYRYFPVDEEVKKIMIENMLSDRMYYRIKSVNHVKRYYSRDDGVKLVAIKMLQSDDRQLNRYGRRLIRGNFESDQDVIDAVKAVIVSFLDRPSSKIDNRYVIWLFDLIEKTYDPGYFGFLNDVIKHARATKMIDNAERVFRSIRVKKQFE
jgi:hypothetical protein